MIPTPDSTCCSGTRGVVLTAKNAAQYRTRMLHTSQNLFSIFFFDNSIVQFSSETSVDDNTYHGTQRLGTSALDWMHLNPRFRLLHVLPMGVGCQSCERSSERPTAACPLSSLPAFSALWHRKTSCVKWQTVGSQLPGSSSHWNSV